MVRLVLVMCVFLVVNGCKTAPVKQPVSEKKETGKTSELDEIIQVFKDSYTVVPQILPQHIKKIAISPFANSTPELGLEDKLYVYVYDEFIYDTTISVTDEDNADGVVTGEITHYILQPLTYFEGVTVEQYKLQVLVDLYFIDKVNNVTLWEEKRLEGVHLFYTSTTTGGISEEEAREIIWEELARKIYRRVIEGYGAETGISEKKVPGK